MSRHSRRGRCEPARARRGAPTPVRLRDLRAVDRRDGYATITVEVGEDTVKRLDEAARKASLDQDVAGSDERLVSLAGYRSVILEAAYTIVGAAPWSGNLRSLAGRERTESFTIELTAQTAQRLCSDASDAALGEGVGEGDGELTGTIARHRAALLDSAFCFCSLSAGADQMDSGGRPAAAGLTSPLLVVPPISQPRGDAVGRGDEARAECVDELRE
jgi:hypothetical protein